MIAHYVVLSLHPKQAREAASEAKATGGAWHVLGTYAAYSADDAIRKSDKQGILVAVPARSWKPHKVTTETKTVLKLEDVTEGAAAE